MTVFIEMIVFELFIHLFSQKHHLRLEKWRSFTNQLMQDMSLSPIRLHWLLFVSTGYGSEFRQ